ncbi:nucleotidyl transferase AbiEii/AbiGii toxin family protein [Flavobacterium sp. I3-2]|uniref:nucleotidyl transferase AbiEii/AbiGii toxin family protein n=1 Tax=Flavobacterium sp. I3-2 TaxID=2748319 RepID=UPI0015ADEB4A|nr:nucleotidyl transferase AbiEii/AbiGii toxin family protein [Flavobacterium sp. I3-2]
METTEYKKFEMIAHEAFIRRAALINSPFMLKGSYVTRQYFNNSKDRIPADLDWVYLNKINDEDTAKEIFNKWATEITELKLNDGVKFRSFKENEFWRKIDYAMADDFPTVNTDLICWVGETKLDIDIDISFNLDIDHSPISLIYKPINGEFFIIANTVPLSLQVSWKIHQTLVRPRFKDLFDLIHLVQNHSFDKKTLELSKQALIKECKADNVDLNKLVYFLNYEIDKLFPNNSINENWDYWRLQIKKQNYTERNILNYDSAADLTDVDKLPVSLSIFLKQFKETLESKGLNIELITDLKISPTKDKTKLDGTNTNLNQNTVQLQDSKKPIVLAKQKVSIWNSIKKIFK